MKTKLLALAFATATIMLPNVAAAQTVGSYDSGNCYPFMCNDSGTSVGQTIDYFQVYAATEFSGPISIQSLTFYLFNGSGETSGTVLNGNYTVSLGTTGSAIGAPIGPVSNVALFYAGNLGGSIGLTLGIGGTPYAYDPADGNLVLNVLVADQDNVPNGAGNRYNWADYIGVVTSRTATVTGLNTFSGTGALVTTFNGGVVPEPATWALLISGFGLVGATMRRRRAVAA